jgi:hypothetical protein
MFLTAVCLLINSCVSEKTTWDKARLENTVRSYEAYMAKHPDGIYCDSARMFIKFLDYQVAESTNTTGSYEEFIRKYPDDSLSIAAQSILENFWIITGLECSAVESVKASCGFSETTVTATEGRIVVIHGNFSVSAKSNNSVAIKDISVSGNLADSSENAEWQYEPIAIGTYIKEECSFFGFNCVLSGSVQITSPEGVGFEFSKENENAPGIISLVGDTVPMCIAFPVSDALGEDFLLNIENRSFSVTISEN